MKYLSNLIIANHVKAPFAICITVFVASHMANGLSTAYDFGTAIRPTTYFHVLVDPFQRATAL